MTVAPAAPAPARRPAPDRSSAPLLSGKLTPPPLGFAPRPRPRLFEMLSEGLDATPVTLLSGPAGAGKTVLAGSWLQADRDDWCAAWLSLEEADDEPAAFWAYLLAALRRAGLELPRSTAPGPAEASPGTLALRLAADLLALPHPVALILDNADSLTRRDLTGALDLLVRRAAAAGALRPRGPAAAAAPVPASRATDRDPGQ
jgi:LuxR family transcriptional regulator, maltose regulon positive regulatory protein